MAVNLEPAFDGTRDWIWVTELDVIDPPFRVLPVDSKLRQRISRCQMGLCLCMRFLRVNHA
jgi:hypothetical protein